MIKQGDAQWKKLRREPEAREDRLVAPLFTGWRGRAEVKPWQYRITAAIPHIDAIEPLRACIDVLRCQTERPYIVIIDTGSSAAIRKELERMRADDLEIHCIAAHGYRHPSEPVAMALDVAQTLCRTEYIFHTHADCFLRRNDFLAEMLPICGPLCPAIGYRMSPREWATDEWEWMVGHTATLLHMPTIERAGAVWSMQRAARQFGYCLDKGRAGGWPDTETGFNRILKAAGIVPHFIGDDVNGRRQTDANIDHVRSYVGSKIYSAAYHQRATPWMEAALSEARQRIEQTPPR